MAPLFQLFIVGFACASIASVAPLVETRVVAPHASIKMRYGFVQARDCSLMMAIAHDFSA
jgi:hypothetical protein